MSSKIEWTGSTWNPIVGCSKVSARCDNCYAMGDSPHRYAKVYDRPDAIRFPAKRAGLTFLPSDPSTGKSLGKGAQWTGEVRCLPHTLEVPLKRRTPTVYFVNSLSDIFHEKLVNDERGRRFIAAIFGVMAACPQHTFQLLTKRPEQARAWYRWLRSQDSPAYAMFEGVREYAPDLTVPVRSRADWTWWPLQNVWLGSSIENDPGFAEIPAAVRFLSLEPLLEDPGELDLRGIHWVITGGESGPKARPMHPDWARSVRDQCAASGVAFWFKQWGRWGWPGQTPDVSRFDQPRALGKKHTGSELDGVLHRAMPSDDLVAAPSQPRPRESKLTPRTTT